MSSAPVRFFKFAYQSNIKGDINGVGLSEPELAEKEKDPDFLSHLQVCKSLPLVELCEGNALSLPARKILDLYLARINPTDPEKRAVVIEKGILERVFGVDRIRNEALQGYLDELSGSFELRSTKRHGTDKNIQLFSTARMEKDRFGIWQIELCCSYEAMSWIFNVGASGYLRYPFTDVVKLTGIHSYALYLYVLSNRFRGNWCVNLDQFRGILGLNGSKSYEKYGGISCRVLKDAKKEIAQKTSLRFSFDPVRKGISAVAIHFCIHADQEMLFHRPEPIRNPRTFEEKVAQMDPANIEDAVLCAVIPEGSCRPALTRLDLKPTVFKIMRNLDYLTVDMAIDVVRRAFKQSWERLMKGSVDHFGRYFYAVFSSMMDEEVKYTKAFQLEFDK